MNTHSPLHIIILAAGKGRRMQSDMPKMLHQLAGRPLVERIAETAQALKPDALHIVYSQKTKSLHEHIHGSNLHWVEQAKSLGTGDAVLQVLDALPKDATVLVLPGDVPLIQSGTLERLLKATSDNQLGLLLVEHPNPKGLGRIIRDQEQHIIHIVEERDASEQEKEIREIFTGILVSSCAHLTKWLPRLNADNAQGEYYLTDIIGLAHEDGISIIGIQAEQVEEVQGVNTRQELIALERHYQYQIAQKLIASGVTIIDPHRFDLRGTLHCETDVTIDINVIIEGNVNIGQHSYIGAHAIIKDTTIGKKVHIHPYSFVDGSEIADDCSIGPFARLRPNTQLARASKIGNFVELKESIVGAGSKINHLSYIGDAHIGQHVNIGAGTITCNYDGVNKHTTTIEDGAFIGSNTQLVAPVTVGRNATIGAGTTLRSDAPSEQLTINDTKQRSPSFLET